LISANQPLPPARDIQRDLDEDATAAAEGAAKLSAQMAPGRLESQTQNGLESMAKEMAAAGPAQGSLVLARLLRWVVDPLDVLHGAEAVAKYHAALARLLREVDKRATRPQTTLSVAILLQVNMHAQAMSLLHEVRMSRTRHPTDREAEISPVHAFAKGAYVQHSLESGVPFFFNPFRMAATMQWLKAPPEAVAAVYLAALCRDHSRRFDEVEEAYRAFCRASNCPPLNPDARAIASIAIGAIQQGNTGLARLYQPPNGPLAALVLLVFTLHDVSDLDAAPPQVCQVYLERAAEQVEQIVLSKLDYNHRLVVEGIRLMLSGYGYRVKTTCGK